jgi:hypothetical protein
MTEESENADLAASWFSERRWFRWTVGFSVGMCLWLIGSAGVVIWFNRRMKATLARTGEASLDDFGLLINLSTGLNLLFFVSGIGFLVSLIKWLLAIRTRRKMQMSVGFQAGQDR